MLPCKRTSVFVVLFLIPCVFSLILPQPFRSLFQSESQNTERQTDIEDQILPVALIAFTASLFNSLVGGLFTPTKTPAVDCTYDGNLDDYHWGYEGVYGPACWGIKYDLCNGMKQSPIDIPKSTFLNTAAETTPLKMSSYSSIRFSTFTNTGENYGPGDDRVSNGVFHNNGHTAQLNADTAIGATQGILSGGQLTGDYQILQLHFHWGANDNQGSEHTHLGKMYPLELHVVHKLVAAGDDFLTTPKGLSVTGFFFEVDGDNDNAALTPLTNELANIEEPDMPLDFMNNAFSLVDLLSPVAPIEGASRSSSYSTYSGSLTTPTCNEVVEWINFLTPLKISRSQLALFRTLDDDDMRDIVDNFRPPQPLNGRTVKFWN